MSKKFVLQKPGTVPYPQALELQLKTLEKRIENKTPDTLILLEHPPTITTGRRENFSNLIADSETLKKRGVHIESAARGGDITFHGPGQIVGYPIVSIRNRKGGIAGYMRDLEEVLIRTLADFGVPARRIEKLTGVWVERDKIASIGVGIRKWTTWHGFALNVNTDLSWFDAIVPCGIAHARMTSIKDRKGGGNDIDADEVCVCLARHFAEIFGYLNYETKRESRN